VQIGWRVIGSYIKSGSVLLFLLMVASHLGLIGSQAMANIWLCMWTDNAQCMRGDWGGGNDTSYNGRLPPVAVYGIIGAIQGLLFGVGKNIMARYPKYLNSI